MPQNIYDDPEFFEGFSQFRRSREGLAGTPEWPALKAMLPPMEGLRVLDLGCGFGAFSRWAREAGAQSVLGVDLSINMLKEAKARTQDSGITYQKIDIENLELPDASFDLVFSSLALHYIEDINAIFAKLRRFLAPDGSFVFSVEHPIYTAPSKQEWHTDSSGERAWIVNNYFLKGKRVTDWITSGVVKYHHTLTSYYNGLIDNGFNLTHLEEWQPTDQQISEQPELVDELHRPIFLLIGARA